MKFGLLISGKRVKSGALKLRIEVVYMAISSLLLAIILQPRHILIKTYQTCGVCPVVSNAISRMSFSIVSL